MKVFRFDTAVARSITLYNSAGFALARVARMPADAVASLAYLTPQGVIGYHPATMPQLLLVVQGEGSVHGADDVWRTLVAGEAAFWEAGEWHETRTVTGLTAVIIESPTLTPEQLA